MATGKQFKLDVIISAVDRFTAPFDAMTKRLNTVNAPMRKLSDSVAGFGQAVGLNTLTERFHNLTSAIGSVGRAAVTTSKRVAGIGAAGLGLGWLFKSQVIDPVEDLQRIGLALQAIEGSADGARNAMAFVKKIDVKSPFESKDIAQSFLLMRNAHMDPTRAKGGLQAIVDRVALMGGNSESLQRAVLSITQMAGNKRIDAANMRELALNQIPAWDILTTALEKKTGRKLDIGQVRKASEDGNLPPGSFQAFMDELGSGAAAGAAEKMTTKTFGGLLSSLSSQFLFFKQNVLKIDDAGEILPGGVMANIQGRLQKALNVLDVLQNNGKLAEWADKIGEAINRGFNWLITEGPGVIDRLVVGFREVYAFVDRVSKLFGGWTNLGIFALGAYIAGPMLLAMATFTAALVKLGFAAGGVAFRGIALLVQGAGWLGNTVPVLTARLWLMNAAGGALGKGLLGVAWAAGIFGAAFAGWKIGSWLRDIEIFSGGLKTLGDVFEYSFAKIGQWLGIVPKVSDSDLELAISSRHKLDKTDTSAAAGPGQSNTPFSDWMASLNGPTFAGAGNNAAVFAGPQAGPIFDTAQPGSIDRFDALVREFRTAVQEFTRARVKIDITSPPGTRATVDGGLTLTQRINMGPHGAGY